jgi:hypothetical protein
MITPKTARKGRKKEGPPEYKIAKRERYEGAAPFDWKVEEHQGMRLFPPLRRLMKGERKRKTEVRLSVIIVEWKPRTPCPSRKRYIKERSKNPEFIARNKGYCRAFRERNRNKNSAVVLPMF